MNVIETAANGVVNYETIFTFNQIKDRVYARYHGGRVSRGMLVGRITGANLSFNYAQVHDDGEVAGGQSNCEIQRLANDQVRLIEHFDWEQGKGRNVFAEIE